MIFRLYVPVYDEVCLEALALTSENLLLSSDAGRPRLLPV
jgi:hypothetical protein